jgi:hypothetical protein
MMKTLNLETILLTKLFKQMRLTKKNSRVCDVTGIRTSNDNFYTNQSHVKAVDNLRRTTGASKQQMRHMFNQMQTY